MDLTLQLPNSNEKICPQCGHSKELDKFGSNGMNMRSSCKKCENKRSRENYQGNRQKVENKLITRLMAAANKEMIDVPHITELCAEMYSQFGGLKQFSEKWMAVINEACDSTDSKNPRFLKMALDSFLSIAKLTLASTEHRQTAPDVFDLSQEDVQAELEEISIRLAKLPSEDLEEVNNERHA